MPFTLIYNFGAAILRTYGDTRRPLIYLTVSGVVNALLNLFFVIVARSMSPGVAIATVIIADHLGVPCHALPAAV